jgi:hypothetical protein
MAKYTGAYRLVGGGAECHVKKLNASNKIPTTAKSLPPYELMAYQFSADAKDFFIRIPYAGLIGTLRRMRGIEPNVMATPSPT